MTPLGDRRSLVPMLRLHLAVVLLLLAMAAAQARVDAPYKLKPRGHEQNQSQVARIHQEQLRKHADETNLLVLPGLIADRRTRRVEMWVERSVVGPDAPCEFLVVGESSDHGYEALLIAFALPSDLHRALRFIGAEPGQSFHPATQRFWAKGERFLLSVVTSNNPSIRVETLLMDRRTDRPLPEEGFLFTGSRKVTSVDDPTRQVYAADAFQPKAMVSLFSTPEAVFEVPRSIPKEVVYRNTTVNPDRPIAEGALLTLVIEPAQPDGSHWAKDLVLQVDPGPERRNPSESEVEALANLRLQLKDGATVLNRETTLVSVIRSMAALDQRTHGHFLTLRWSDGVALDAAQALAEILASVDREQGVRIDPPAPGDLYYRAFTPDRELLDRGERPFHPVELGLQEKDGRISGRLLLFESVWKEGASRSELQFLERTILNPADLRRELAADRERKRSSGKRSRPAVMLAFAPSHLTIGQVTAFLEPVLTNQTAIHLFLDESAPAPPARTSAP